MAFTVRLKIQRFSETKAKKENLHHKDQKAIQSYKSKLFTFLLRMKKMIYLKIPTLAESMGP